MNQSPVPESLLRPDVLHELMETGRAMPPGDFVEVGVYKGGSARALAEVAREQGRSLHLFDTFCGIPHADAIDVHKVGDFADTQLSDVAMALAGYDVCIHMGIFPRTLPASIHSVALAHIDCDQYGSVKACCEALAPLMVPGGVMVFDDYDVLPGARLAVEEAFAGRITTSPQGKARVTF